MMIWAHALMCAIHSLRSVQAATLFIVAMKQAWQGTITNAVKACKKDLHQYSIYRFYFFRNICFAQHFF